MVYPRACGGTGSNITVDWLGKGLSPRVRGNPTTLRMPPLEPRSIPARAGEPRPFPGVIGMEPVYPRACGGTQPAARTTTEDDGLSPRVRGNHFLWRFRRPVVGSIPARAGEPRTSIGTLTWRRVYPRACGGTVLARIRAYAGMGLSPRVRGNL